MMKFFEKHPMVMLVVGIVGVSMSAIFAKYSQAPSVVTAAYRLLWTVALMTPVVLGKAEIRRELLTADRRSVLICALGGIFLALHFTAWFESLNETSVASSTAIVCTEVIWVALGFCIFLKGRISGAAVFSILITVAGSLMIACADYSSGGNHLYGDGLALAAAMFCAVYTLIGRQARRHMSTAVYTYIVYVSCSCALCVAVAVSGVPFTGYGMVSVTAGLLLSICCTLLGHSVFSWCLKFLSPSFISASKLCEPVVAAVFAFLLFGEVPGFLQILGGAVTIGGVLLYSRVESGDHK